MLGNSLDRGEHTGCGLLIQSPHPRLNLRMHQHRPTHNHDKTYVEPVFEADMLVCSYGFRPKRGA